MACEEFYITYYRVCISFLRQMIKNPLERATVIFKFEIIHLVDSRKGEFKGGLWEFLGSEQGERG